MKILGHAPDANTSPGTGRGVVRATSVVDSKRHTFRERVLQLVAARGTCGIHSSTGKSTTKSTELSPRTSMTQKHSHEAEDEKFARKVAILQVLHERLRIWL